MENRDMMTTAWSNITGLKPIPPDRPELKEDEDEDGLLFSMKYIVSLIDEQVSMGIPPGRIVVGGFSQGCALGLLTGLVSKHAGQLGGIIGLAGYMPLADRIPNLRKDLETPEGKHMPTFLMRGSRDMLLPSSFYPLPRLEAMGYGDQVESHIYDVGHTISGPVIQDLCTWLEKVVPEEKAT
jgi:predicted esterase